MQAIPLRLLKYPSVFLATGFGSGLSPFAPGTFGTFVALALFTVINDTTWTLLVICVISFVFGIFICDKTSQKLNTHDHGGIVWDEFVGLWITMLWVPITPLNLALAFIIFRAFDILKPWPISALDKNLKGGLGIMTDDVVAGLFSNLILQIFLWFY